MVSRSRKRQGRRKLLPKSILKRSAEGGFSKRRRRSLRRARESKRRSAGDPKRGGRRQPKSQRSLR